MTYFVAVAATPPGACPECGNLVNVGDEVIAGGSMWMCAPCFNCEGDESKRVVFKAYPKVDPDILKRVNESPEVVAENVIKFPTFRCYNCGKVDHDWTECQAPTREHKIMEALEVYERADPPEDAKPLFTHYYCLCGRVVEKDASYATKEPDCYKALIKTERLPEPKQQYGY